jgi:FkbM family methyltransferase
VNWRIEVKQWYVQRSEEEWDYWFEKTDCTKNEPQHFDFIEIGTSNYHSFTQAVVEHPDGKPYAWNFLPWDKHPLSLRGLAVDMQQNYLNQLPDLPNVTKVCAAVSESGGTKGMFHVPLGDVEHWENVMTRCGSWKGHQVFRLARGCSALKNHGMLLHQLKTVGLSHLARTRRVRTLSLNELLLRHKVASVGVLAIDCEGYDCAILRGLISACLQRPEWWPEWIWFETNGMNDELLGQGTEEETVRALLRHGYMLWWGGGYASSGYRDTVMKRGESLQVKCTGSAQSLSGVYILSNYGYDGRKQFWRDDDCAIWFDPYEWKWTLEQDRVAHFAEGTWHACDPPEGSWQAISDLARDSTCQVSRVVAANASPI